MHISHPVEAEGRFLGVAVPHETAWRFVAIDPAVEDIDGRIFPSPAEARRVAGLVLTRSGRAPTGEPPPPPPASGGGEGEAPGNLVHLADRRAWWLRGRYGP